MAVDLFSSPTMLAQMLSSEEGRDILAKLAAQSGQPPPLVVGEDGRLKPGSVMAGELVNSLMRSQGRAPGPVLRSGNPNVAPKLPQQQPFDMASLQPGIAATAQALQQPPQPQSFNMPQQGAGFTGPQSIGGYSTDVSAPPQAPTQAPPTDPTILQRLATLFGGQ